MGILLLGVFPLAYLIQPCLGEMSGTVCFFRTWTGRPCIFCGLTRAFASATHGDFAAAREYNILWGFAMLLVFTIGLIAVCDGLSNRNGLGSLARGWDRWAWPLIALLAIATALRAVGLF